MNEAEEEAEFFLPHGILDDSDTEAETNHEPLVVERSGSPPQNPWEAPASFGSRPTALDSRAEQQEPPAAAAWTVGEGEAAMNMDGNMPQTTLGDNEHCGLATAGLIGNSSYEQTMASVEGPLQERTVSRYEMFPPTRPAQRTATEPFDHRANIAPASTSMLPPRVPATAPPGFERQPSNSRVVEPPRRMRSIHLQHSNHSETSLLSDSSVPRELYGRESGECWTSSLSLSSCGDGELSSTVVGSTPDESTKNAVAQTPSGDGGDNDLSMREESSSQDEKLKRESLGDTDEKKATPLDSTDSAPQSSQSDNETSCTGSTTRPTTSTHTKHRSRRGGKGRRERSVVAETNSSAVCSSSQSVRQKSERTSIEWIVTTMRDLLHCLWCALCNGASSVISLWRRSLPFRKRVSKRLQDGSFAVVRIAAILISVLWLVCKSSFLEAKRDANISLTFAYMYVAPGCISWLMAVVVLPHWTPHIISCIGWWVLCLPSGENSSPVTLKDVPKLAQHSRKLSGQQIGEIILLQSRYTIPIMLFEDGFANEFGTIMSLDSAGRLLVAYGINILRTGLLFSPIVWLSGGFQLLITTYLDATAWVDLSILVIGLASIRFARFIQKRVAASKALKAKRR